MIQSLKKKFIDVSKTLHLKIFRHEMSRAMENFIVSLTWSLFGGIAAAIIIFIINLLAARWLGPTEYGKYNLVIVIASLLIIPMMLGFEVSAGRFISLEKTKEEKEKVSRFILKKSAKNIFIISILLLLVFSILGKKFNFSNSFFYFSLVLAITLSFKGIANGILRGNSQFKKQATLRFFESIVIGFAFLFLFGLFKRTYESYVFATLIGYAYFAFSSIGRNFLHLKNETYHKKEILKYGHFAFLGLLSTFLLTGSDKILVNKFIDIFTVGIYSAYFTVAIAPVTQLRYIFINVLFPEISNSNDKSIQLKKINKLALVILPIFLVLYPLIIFLLMKLYGSKYPIDLWLIFMFSIYAFLFFYVGVNQWILASISTRMMLVSSMIALFVGVLQIMLTITALIYTKNLHFLLGAIIFSNIIYLFLNNYYIKKNLQTYE